MWATGNTRAELWDAMKRVELGQLFFVGGVWTVLLVLHRPDRVWPRWLQAVPAYAIGAVAMFWVIERTLAFAR